MKTFLRLLQSMVFVLALSSLFSSTALSSPVGLIPANANWKYNDSGTDQGTAWRALEFNDQSWASGPAQLGFGDGDEATMLNRGNGWVTAYFRHSFAVANPAAFTELTMRLLRDDGAVVYLNGVEVARQNMPSGEVHYNTLALAAVGGAEESTLGPPFGVPASLLRAGANLVAVEVHQSSVASSDLSFALELLTGGDNPPPTNNPPTVEIAATDGEGMEISPLLDRIPDPAVFTVSRSGPTTGSLLVGYAMSGNAGNGVDYEAVSGQVTIPAGSSSAEIRIEVIDDKLVEGTEHVAVRLLPCTVSNTTQECYRLGTAFSATALILDDEPANTNQPPDVLIAAGSVWKYLDNGVDQGTVWRNPGFDDASWASGPAQLGYGEGDEATVVNFGPDPANRYITTYFRRTFDVTNPGAISNLTLRLLRDDGAVVYLNGVEVVRDNMPPGAVTFATLASSVGAEENVFIQHHLSAGNLVAGQNTLAVEVHQVSPASSDLSFDLSLHTGSGGTPTNPPPRPVVSVTATDPNASEGGILAVIDTGTFSFRRTGDFSGALPIAFRLGGTASNGVDYVTVTGEVVIPAGAAEVQVRITPIYDEKVEGTETVVVTILPPPGCGTNQPSATGCYSIGISTATVFLRDFAGPPPETNTLVAAGAVWRYRDGGVDQGTAWRAAGFNDSSWSSGAAQLGFGDGDEVTVISRGPETAPLITAYFRRTFEVANPGSISNLTLRLLRDDGAVVYLNGVEVVRDNMPPGEVTYATLASSVSSEENVFVEHHLSAGNLVAGQNTLAVEVHQASAASSDLSFDLSLHAGSGSTPTNPPPRPVVTVIAIDPNAAETEALAAIDSGTFSFRRTGDLGAALLVAFRIGCTASNSVDYLPVAGQVIIPAGAPEAQVRINPIFDEDVEATETVVVTLLPCETNQPSTGCYSVGIPTATVFIRDFVSPPPEPDTLIAAGSVWKYQDSGVDQGTAWRAAGFNDSSWSSGAAQLGFGDGDEVTLLSRGPDNAPLITAYFRRTFHVADPSQVNGLRLRLLRDDGAVVYLNGSEVFRSNMPEGPISYHTLAAQNPANENEFVEAVLNSSVLVAGENLVAVEVHQVSPTSSDLSFDLALLAQGGSNTNDPPLVTVRVSNAPAAEAGSIAGRFVVNLSRPVPHTLLVSFGLGGSASNGVDYAGIQSTLMFAPGQTSAFITVTPIDDSLIEGTEVVRVSLHQILVAPGGQPPYNVGVPGTAELIIVDNDSSPTNAPATLTITAPPDGSRFPVGADIVIRAVARDPDDPAPLVVQFYANNQFIGESAPVFITAPLPGQPVMHSVVWSNAPAGDYNVVARARAINGAPGAAPVITTISSPAIRIFVGDPPPPGERELHVVGVYSGATPSGGSSRNHEVTDARVVVDRPGKQVTLVLSAYEPVRWHLEVRAGTIERILLGGYYEQTIEGVPPGVEVVGSVYTSTPQNYLYVGYEVDDGEFYRAIRILKGMTGLEVSSFHGDYTATLEPYVINEVQNDPRLHSSYPVPTPLSELPEISFELTFHSGNLFRRAYTLGGPVEGSQLLPAVRVISDGHGSYFSAENHSIQKIDATTGTSQEISLPPELPELSWPMGTAYDSRRERVLVVTLGGEGFLYGYNPVANQWSLVRSMNNLDLDSLEYHAAGDALYAVGIAYDSAPVVHRLSPDGVPQSRITLPVQPFDITPGRYHSELVSVGEYLVLLLEPRHFWGGDVEESRIYLIDPRSGQYWLTYRHTRARPPVISISSPSSGAEFIAPANINIVAQGHDADGWIRLVEFFADDTKIGEVALEFFQAPPPGQPQRFEFSWENVPVGTYALTVRATDSMGETTKSAPVSVTVRVERPAPEVTIFASRAVAFEGEPNSSIGNEGIFTVRLDHPADHPLTVFYTIGGTAQNGVDYREIQNRIAVPAGALSAQIVIDPFLDTVIEGTETVILTLLPGLPDSEMPSRYVVGPFDRATVLIQESEGTNTLPVVTIFAPDSLAREQGLDPGNFLIRRSGDTGRPLRVHYLIRGTAQNATDYAEIGSSVEIPAGSSSVNVVITPKDDDLVEARENVLLTLWLPPMLNPLPPAYRVGAPSNAVVYIEDSDTPEPTNGLPVVNIQATDAFASEQGGGTNTATFTITRTGSTDHAMVVWYRSEGSASNGVDYVRVQNTALIPAGASSVEVVITPIPDSEEERLESVTLSLYSPPLAFGPTVDSIIVPYLVGRNARAAAVIADTDEHFPGCVRLPGGEIFLCLPGVDTIPVRLEASSDLITWEPLVDTTAVGGEVHFADPAAAQFSVRFYRAVRR